MIFVVFSVVTVDLVTAVVAAVDTVGSVVGATFSVNKQSINL